MTMKPGKHKKLIERLATLTEMEAEFYLKVTDKYLKRANENNRPLAPWDVYELPFLMDRLVEEMQELITAYGSHDNDAIKDECLDVTNFARFIYEYANKED